MRQDQFSSVSRLPTKGIPQCMGVGDVAPLLLLDVTLYGTKQFIAVSGDADVRLGFAELLVVVVQDIPVAGECVHHRRIGGFPLADNVRHLIVDT